MKRIALNLFVLSCMTFTIFAQSNNDNTIVIENFDKSKFSEIETILLYGFYEIERYDTTAFRFNTKTKPIEDSVYAYDLNVSLHGFIVNNELITYANYTFRGGSYTGETYSGRARHSRRANTGATLAFAELKRLMKQLNMELSYRQMN